MKKLTAAILTVLMVLTLLPTMAMAGTGSGMTADDPYMVSSDAELKYAIEQGTYKYIKLANDIVVKPTEVNYWQEGWKETHPFCVVTRELTLDLNGKKISYDQTPYTPTGDTTIFYVFLLVENANMTVTGNGAIDASLEACANPGLLVSMCFRLHNDAKATLVIENGTYETNVVDTKDERSNRNVILVKNGGGTVTINGGLFAINDGSGIVLNVDGNTWEQSGQPKKIIVNGGTVKGLLGYYGEDDEGNEITIGETVPKAKNNTAGNTFYYGEKDIAAAVNSGEDVTVTKGGEINGIEADKKLKIGSDVTGVKVNGVLVAANQEVKTWKVSFKNGEEVIDTKTVVNGEKVTATDKQLTKEGHTFAHWHVAGSTDDIAFDFNTAITGNIELTAHWTKNSSGRYHGSSTPAAPVESPKTFDAGVAVYGVMALTSVMGMGYISKKKF